DDRDRSQWWSAAAGHAVGHADSERRERGRDVCGLEHRPPRQRLHAPSERRGTRRRRERTVQHRRVLTPQRLLEELEDAAVFIGPAVVAAEAVRLDRVYRRFPVLLAELDEPLDQARRVLE